VKVSTQVRWGVGRRRTAADLAAPASASDLVANAKTQRRNIETSKHRDLPGSIHEHSIAS